MLCGHFVWACCVGKLSGQVDVGLFGGQVGEPVRCGHVGVGMLVWASCVGKLSEQVGWAGCCGLCAL